MDRGGVSEWLDRYVEAWKNYDRDAIGDLFSEDAEYRFYPWEEPKVGRAAIVESWFEDPDEPGSFEAHYEPVAVDGDVAVARGTSEYAATDDRPERVYYNCFILRFAPDGRCSEYTEYYNLKGDDP